MVNHDTLLEKLKYYGICGLPLNWLSPVSQADISGVKINNAKSDNKTIVCGVPHGSVLGPFLFLKYINDIYKSAPKVCFHLFAGDTCLFYSNKKMEIWLIFFLITLQTGSR